MESLSYSWKESASPVSIRFLWAEKSKYIFRYSLPTYRNCSYEVFGLHQISLIFPSVSTLTSRWADIYASNCSFRFSVRVLIRSSPALKVVHCICITFFRSNPRFLKPNWKCTTRQKWCIVSKHCSFATPETPFDTYVSIRCFVFCMFYWSKK